MASSPVTQAADWTIGRLLLWTTDFLRRNGIDEPRLATEVLLAHAAGCRRIELYTRFDGTLTTEQTACFREWVRRAAAQEPIAYLVGEREFFSLPFAVTRDVLIPRPESELLVEAAVEHCTRVRLPDAKILDVGTGSGCLVISILSQLRLATAVASDVSEQALVIARTNAQRHGVAERLRLVQADRLAIPAESSPPGGFDVLVCNPPYIPSEQINELPTCIRDFEPHLALTDESDGLSFYRSVGADGPRLLAPGGLVIMEVGDGQAPAAISTMLASGAFEYRATCKDRVVGKERVIVLSRITN